LKVAQLGAIIINIFSSSVAIPFMPTISKYSRSKLTILKIMDCVHHENPDLRVFNIYIIIKYIILF
jgi:short-subunit dehydrogenase